MRMSARSTIADGILAFGCRKSSLLYRECTASLLVVGLSSMPKLPVVGSFQIDARSAVVGSSSRATRAVTDSVTGHGVATRAMKQSHTGQSKS
jgi:hypothetical protein